MHTTLGGLSCEVLPEAKGPPRAAVVLCHGFGAPGDDLVGLHRELLQLQPGLAQARFVFPEAPLSLGPTVGFDGRAWWLIDFEQIERIGRGDVEALRAFRKVEPQGMAKARSLLTALVHALCAQTGLGLSRVVLGGFSQGAMLSTDVALRLEEAPLGLVVLSSTLLLEDTWRAKAKARSGLPVFQSHGQQDPLLPYSEALRLKDLFLEAGMPHTWVPFRGGHQIDLEVLEQAAAFLAARVAS